MQRMLLLIVILLCLVSAIAWGAAAPTITSFTPTFDLYGQEITLTGTTFTGATAVAINGITAPIFKVLSDTSLTVTVPTGATTGTITVTTPAGTATSATAFTVCNNLKDGAEMVWVPGATFTMGTPADIQGMWANYERPAHQVTLSSYWIYKYDVTVAQYRVFCTATGRALPEFPKDDYSWKGKKSWEHPGLQQHPIVNVSWNDAKAYADWAGVKLPTEAQWEYAARGPKGNNYSWGGIATIDDFRSGWDKTKCANYFNSYKVGKSTWPVGSFQYDTSWCDAQDMAGNVWQWCTDWFGDYSATAVTDPTGPATGTHRVFRGGS